MKGSCFSSSLTDCILPYHVVVNWEKCVCVCKCDMCVREYVCVCLYMCVHARVYMKRKENLNHLSPLSTLFSAAYTMLADTKHMQILLSPLPGEALGL